MQISQGKVFELAEPGSYIGTIIDLVDMPAPIDPRTGQPATKVVKGKTITEQDRLRIQWALAYETNAPYLGKEGPITIAGFYSAVISTGGSKLSNLTKLLISMFGSQLPLIQTSEQLEQLLLGRSNRLMVTKEPKDSNPSEFYNKIVAVMPLNPGQVPVPVPQGFVRAKFKTQQTAGPQGTPVATYATREAAMQAGQTIPTPAAAPVSFARPATGQDAF